MPYDYKRISSKNGASIYYSQMIHDDSRLGGGLAGGQNSLFLGTAGTGKTSALSILAKTTLSLKQAGKRDLVELLASTGNLKYADDAGFKLYREGCLWRMQDFDGCLNLIRENQLQSELAEFPAGQRPDPDALRRQLKNCTFWISDDDVGRILFYSHDVKDRISAVPNLPRIRTYTTALDLVKKMDYSGINVVLSPQKYRLSHELAIRLRERKMEIPSEDEEFAIIREEKKTIPDKKRAKYHADKYESLEVNREFFWFDVISSAINNSNYRPISIFIDEFDSVIEQSSAGLSWALTQDLTSRIRTLRKANISLFLASHQWAHVDWRLTARMNYYCFFRGVSTNKASMIREQSLISNLAIGQCLLEEKSVRFGIMQIPKIKKSMPPLRIDGLREQPASLSPKDSRMIVKSMEDHFEFSGGVKCEET